MIKKIILLIISLAILGCATYNPVPKGYTGPVVKIVDSVKQHSESKSDFFYVDKVDGKYIKDSRTQSIAANNGNGFILNPVVIGRDVPAGHEITLTLVARTEYGAPVLTLSNKVYEVTGELTFIPEQSNSYIVKGKLGENYSAVWLENQNTNAVVGDLFEIHGSSALGFFEK